MSNKKSKLYVIQNGCVGNNMYFMGFPGHGYTTDFNNAGVYSYDDVKRIVQVIEKSLTIWPFEYIRRKICHTVRIDECDSSQIVNFKEE